MKTGVAINFSADKTTIDLTDTVQGFNAQGQNAVVNVVTRVGSDKVVPQKGTNMEQRAMLRNSFDPVWAVNTVNFAALRTLRFIRRTDRDAETLSTLMDRLILRPGRYADQRFNVLVEATNDNGEQYGNIDAGLRLTDLDNPPS